MKVVKKYSLSLFFILSLTTSPLFLSAQTIAEKKESFRRKDAEIDTEGLGQIKEMNVILEEKRAELKALYGQAHALFVEGAGEKSYADLVSQARLLAGEITQMQQMWRDETISLLPREEYALWHQPETTLQQIVMDYGAGDYMYLIPPEVGGIRMSLNSSLPIPREAWGECLELILEEYGIGIRQLNPYLRELYILRSNPSGIKALLDSPQDLDAYPSHARVCFVLSPSGADPRSDLYFLEKFANPTTTKLEIVGGKIFITSQVEGIQELLKLYLFAGRGEKREEYQVVSLSKIDAQEMEVMLLTAFHDGKLAPEGSSLRVIPLKNPSSSLFLAGSKEEVKKAFELIQELEGQIETPQEKTVFWYTTKHSDPEELASVLAKVYDLLVSGSDPSTALKKGEIKKIDGAKKEDKLVVPAISVGPKAGARTSHKTADGQNNFIVDPKTGAIIMVVEQDALPKIKELLKKLDVPKKMVQIEVLLFEKKVSSTNNFGLNLLRLGPEAAKNVTKTGLNWGGGAGAGILEFFLSRTKGSGIPAYDLTYQFMLGQEDVQINASPSVTTINQTPATIAIVEEVSIDSGADKDKNRLFSRAQYGITIQITPTINMDDNETLSEGTGFITLDTDITFDSPKKSQSERPDVTRRHIRNHVRIADGQTVILGGLRRKSTQDNKESLPFLGEIPGIGKLFSHTQMSDSSTEMFVFITPKIISDPLEDAEKIRKEELRKRPGDVPEFLQQLVKAQDSEKKRLFKGTLTTLFGRGCEPSIKQKRIGEYDGR